MEGGVVMQFDTHGHGHGLNDLYILPETKEETEKITNYLHEKGWCFYLECSNVPGHPWRGKIFINIAFGENLKDEIEAL